jgi:hypothetical protein
MQTGLEVLLLVKMYIGLWYNPDLFRNKKNSKGTGKAGLWSELRLSFVSFLNS